MTARPELTPGQRLRFGLLNRGASTLARLDFNGLERLGAGLGSLMWACLPWRRKLAIGNVARHIGVPRDEAREIARQSFCHSGRSFTEILLTDRFGLDSPRLRFAQPDLKRALSECARPIVATTAHIGAWELLASLLGQIYAPPRPRMVVVRRYHDPAVQAFLTTRREASGATMIGHRTVAAQVLKALRQNGIVAFLVDHHALRGESLLLPFLGEESAVNMGPALLALRAEALLWPIFLLRDGGDYVMHLEAPLDTATLTGTREEKVREAALFYTGAVERAIRAHPAQWFWMHNRWKHDDADKDKSRNSPSAVRSTRLSAQGGHSRAGRAGRKDS